MTIWQVLELQKEGTESWLMKESNQIQITSLLDQQVDPSGRRERKRIVEHANTDTNRFNILIRNHIHPSHIQLACPLLVKPSMPLILVEQTA